MCASYPDFDENRTTIASMSLLEGIRGPRDLRALSKRQLEVLAEEIPDTRTCSVAWEAESLW